MLEGQSNFQQVLENYVEAKVVALVDPITRDWNIDILNELFVDRDVELIKKIPIAIGFEEQWCWRGDVKFFHHDKISESSSNGDLLASKYKSNSDVSVKCIALSIKVFNLSLTGLH
nr:uncharacterized protein LOC109146988 [Ipomoea batatas]